MSGREFPIGGGWNFAAMFRPARPVRLPLVAAVASALALIAPFGDQVAADAVVTARPSAPAMSTAAPAKAATGKRAAAKPATTTAPSATGASPATAPATDAVVHSVSAATQADLAAYWTTARLASAHADETGTPAYQNAGRAVATAASFAGVPSVGALFTTSGGAGHYCTASVVDSPKGDLVMTAAHCVGGGSGGAFSDAFAFVPGYHDGQAPLGVWVPTSITVAGAWRRGSDPNSDVAFVTVRPAAGGSARLQDSTGANSLSLNAGYHNTVQPIGYPAGAADPVTCQTSTTEAMSGQLKFDCHGFFDGTSGGPLLADYDATAKTGAIVGDIGGYQQGGAYEYTSYSPAYGNAVGALYARAQLA